MKGQGARGRGQGPRIGNGMILFLAACSLLLAPLSYATDKWPGVDEAVVEKIAKEHGRAAHQPLINTDQGDILLFAFLLAGAAGGFAAGYYWRVLTGARTRQDEVVQNDPDRTIQPPSGDVRS